MISGNEDDFFAPYFIAVVSFLDSYLRFPASPSHSPTLAPSGPGVFPGHSVSPAPDGKESRLPPFSKERLSGQRVFIFIYPGHF